jgi:selenocysteine lyase/cysteine desulfurase
MTERAPAATPTPSLVGANVQVPLLSGSSSRYINLDYAASTPPLTTVADAVSAFLPWYSSVHRGAGYKSQIATAAYEGARKEVGTFFGTRADDAVIFVRNTTDATNLLASALPCDAEVFAFEVEHHANLLPWRKAQRGVTYLPMPESPAEALEALDTALAAASGRDAAPPRLVALTGASNVTGEIWPRRELVEVSHRYGARVLLDGAQIAAHDPIDMAAIDVDYLAVSAHKMYAPFGAGALLGRADWLEEGDPYLFGGGAVDFVTTDAVLWTGLPDRQEAGTPNVVGAVAMGVACRTLAQSGMASIAAAERHLGAYAREHLGAIDGVELYSLWDPAADRLGLVTFNVRGYWHSQVAAFLSAEFGIGVRHGCFCAHPLMLHLLQVKSERADQLRARIALGDKTRVPGAVRASFGLGTTREDIDELCRAVGRLVSERPASRYRQIPNTDDYIPDPDTRQVPVLPFALAPATVGGGGRVVTLHPGT